MGSQIGFRRNYLIKDPRMFMGVCIIQIGHYNSH